MATRTSGGARPRRPRGLRQALPGLARLGRHVRPHLAAERRLLAGGTVALLAEVVLRLLEPWPLKFVIDAVVAAPGPEPTGGPGAAGLPVDTVLVAASLALVVFATARAGTAYLATLAFALAGNRLLTGVRSDLYAHLHRLSMTFHDRSRTGDLVTRLTSDVGRLKEVAVTAALPLAGNTLTLAGMLLVVAALDWRLALVLVLVLPAFGLTGVRTSGRIHAVSQEQRRAEGALASLATETLTSMRVVQSYSLEDRLQGRFAASNARSLRDGVRAKRLTAGLERRTDVLVGVATAVVLYVGARRVLAGALTPGELVVFLTYLKAAFKPMRDVAKYTGRVAQAAASAERIVDVLERAPEVVDAPGARPAPRFAGRLELRGVEMAYRPGQPVLHDVDLLVPAGQRLALVGPSGAGKSSVAMLLSRLCDPVRGQVLVDGQDLRELTLASVRRQVAVVLQDSVLLASSVRDNIALGAEEATDAEVEAAARLAGAHDFVTRLPDGYDTVLGERGDTLSGGERQRIAVARAAVRDAPVVVLDEATTGLDQETEREVRAALDRLTTGRTTVVITHDLDAVLGCDRAVWLQDGRVHDDGPPAEVLARQAAGWADARLG